MADIIAAGIISSANLGCTNSVRGIMSTYRETEKLDLFESMKAGVSKKDQAALNFGYVDKIKSRLGDNPMTKLEIVAAGETGIEFLRDFVLSDPALFVRYKMGLAELFLVSDKYHDIPLSKFNRGIAILAPESALREYAENNKGVAIKAVPFDVPASLSKSALLSAAADFESGNPYAANLVRDLQYGMAEFLGGRVQGSDGKWKENTEEIFAKEADDMMERAGGQDILVGTHGLRTFTKSDGSNDFAPFNEFARTVRRRMREGQKVAMLAQEETNNAINPLNPSFIMFFREGSEIGLADLSLENTGGAYEFMLLDAIQKRVPLRFTAEQMNFIPEMLELGGDISNVDCSCWGLSTPSNLDTNRILLEKARNGIAPLNARDAFVLMKKDESKRHGRMPGFSRFTQGR